MNDHTDRRKSVYAVSERATKKSSGRRGDGEDPSSSSHTISCQAWNAASKQALSLASHGEMAMTAP
jgi:hypothetical protein